MHLMGFSDSRLFVFQLRVVRVCLPSFSALDRPPARARSFFGHVELSIQENGKQISLRHQSLCLAKRFYYAFP
jgi:hypothetical protein